MTRARPALSSPQRRRLLGALAATGFLGAFERHVALAQTANDYRALVCIVQQGGNDGENMLIRYDNAGYQNYASVRPVASGINVPRAQLLPIQPASTSFPFGFHPACAPLKVLFEQKKLAVIANVGMLARPVTRAGLESQNAPRPANLFSHTDQELAVQSAYHQATIRVGWGGRIADRLEQAYPGLLFPSLTSIAGLRTYVSGQMSVPLTVPENPYFQLFGAGPGQFQFDALREAAFREVLAQGYDNVYDIVAQVYSQDGLSAASVVMPILQNPSSVVSPFFAGLNSSVARQLRTVAQLIEGRAQTQLKRQLFLVNQPAYDTHAEQLPAQNMLLGDLSQALKAFQDALAALGLTNNVTAFTLSEFGRTFKPAVGQGTDHGWGNYAFVVGGAVKGGDFYGTLPTQALNGPDDLGNAGRWIPTTSLEQYGATLVRWLGLPESDLPFVFPNIGAFANTNMGFMA